MGLFKKLAIFLVGMYAGVYVDQQYEIPRADDPKALYEKLMNVLEQYKKDNGKDKDR